MKYLAALALVFLLTACGGAKLDASNTSAVNGTYTSLDGKESYTFLNGTVRVKTQEASYVVEGGAIKFRFDGGVPALFVVNPDDRSLSLYGMTFKKL